MGYYASIGKMFMSEAAVRAYHERPVHLSIKVTVVHLDTMYTSEYYITSVFS